MDLTAKLRPLVKVLRHRREQQGRSAGDVSVAAGVTRTWVTEMESGKGCINPAVSRLMVWAQAVEAQEFGVYVIIDGNYTSVALHGDEDEEDEPVDELLAAFDAAPERGKTSRN